MRIIHAALLTLLLGTGCAFVPKTSTPVTSTSEPEDSKSLRELAENGNARAQYKLGLNYVNGGNEEATEDDTGGYKEAFKWWRKAAQRNHPHAQYYLGVMYSNGLGVGKDYKEAYKWWRRAVEQNHSLAQNNLGAMYGNGLGIQEDHVTAYAWYDIAAINGQKIAEKNKTIIAKKMTLEEIGKGDRLSKELRQRIEANLKVK